MITASSRFHYNDLLHRVCGTHFVALIFAFISLFISLNGTQDAIANGDTRTIDLYHSHTKESLRVTFRRDGGFDPAALDKLNWFLRDWRTDEPTTMSPDLFDIVWYSAREAGASEPIRVVSAYRSPGTNAMLARRSRAVAKNSQHMRGHAMDFTIPGISMAKVREIAMRLQRGGVGYYPSAGTPFVHLDVGSVRSWPRMPRDALERLFPDGKTVHIPADGKPLANYEAALAEVQSRGGSALDYASVSSNKGKSLWALLFGGGDEDEDTASETPRSQTSSDIARRNRPNKKEDTFDPSETTRDNPMQVSSLVEQRSTTLSAPRLANQAPNGAIGAIAGLLSSKEQAPQRVTLQAVDLPAPPQRPKRGEFQAMLATLAPLPPIRPESLGFRNVASVQPSEQVAVLGLPAPPSRPAALTTLRPTPTPLEGAIPPRKPMPIDEKRAQQEPQPAEGVQLSNVSPPRNEFERKILAVAALKAAKTVSTPDNRSQALKPPTAFLGFTIPSQ